MFFDILTVVGSLIGGLGLFLLAIGMMTDGLKLAAGPSLRKILSEWTSTPLKGILSGFTMTAIVQSSSAVTVASIGFVNAGLLNMRQALGIVYGSNVGTTMTGWLVALIGFKLNIQAFALPLIGIGMLFKLVRSEGRLASFGMALVGFGLFFVGVDVLKSAFEGLVHTFDITKVTVEGLSGILLFLLIGVVMTVLTQSSSAAIALTITAASSGMVGIYAAAAMVIGANVGTTSTAALASIGATSQAKRVAAAQVIFNVITALVALVTLPILFFIINAIGKLLGLETAPGITLALFHSVFNVLGVLLVFPFNDRLASFLEKRFLSRHDEELQPRFLDKTIAMTPILAVNALLLESKEIAIRLSEFCSQVFASRHSLSPNLAESAKAIRHLSEKVSKFIVNIESSVMSEETTNQLAVLMRIEQYYVSCSLIAERVFTLLNQRTKLSVESLEKSMVLYVAHTHEFISQGQLNEPVTRDQLEQQRSDLHAEHDKLKAGLLLAATRGQIPVDQMAESVDCLGEINRLNKQWCKALMRLKQLQSEVCTVVVDKPEREVESQ